MLAAMELTEIPNRLKLMGSSQTALARELRLDPSSLSKTLKGKRQLKAHEMLAMEKFFGDALENTSSLAQISDKRKTAPKRIPVYGYAAAGGGERVVINPGHVLDWVDAPPLWNGLGNMVVVRIIGDSMEPRYFAGETVFVHIGLPPGRGQDCLIEFHDGSAVIKSYRGERDGFVFAYQYNPPANESNEVRYPGAEVKAIHAVELPSRPLR